MVRLRTGVLCYAAAAPKSSFPGVIREKSVTLARRAEPLGKHSCTRAVFGWFLRESWPIRGEIAGGAQTMAEQLDDAFYERADAHIHLSNDQTKTVESGKVSASMLYGTARFNAWLSACWVSSREEMVGRREETIDYFVTQFRAMLEDNLDDYIRNFDGYMKPKNQA
jgi:hypothetical protein